jgi:hypothetical protein
MTALGPVRLERSHACCPGCGQAAFPADGLLGLRGWLSCRALAMACRAGIHEPFRKAERLLSELAGWSVDAETLRRRCHEQAAAASARRDQRGALPAAFARAPGERELHIDAGKVNTAEGGWRDLKMALLLCRARGAASSSEDYDQRDLPAPQVRAVVAAVEEARAFGRRCADEAKRLGVPPGAGLSVLGDGAEWIWRLAGEHFGGAAEVLDVYHAVEHLAEAGRAALGEGAALQRWLGAARRKLVGDGYAGAAEALAAPLEDAEARRRLDGASGEVLNYLAANRGRLGYAARLSRGQAIGTGAVEGAIKELVNLRLKRTGARWRTRHVGPFVEMLAMADSAEWGEHWASLAS